MNNKEKNKKYSISLALFDFVPVLLFGMSMILFIKHGCSILAGGGLFFVFLGGLCKAYWKYRVASDRGDSEELDNVFRRIMPAGGILLLAAGVRWALKGQWHGFFTGTRWIWLLLFIVGMIGMGFLKSRQDQGNHMVWCAEITNTISQLMLFIYALLGYISGNPR